MYVEPNFCASSQSLLMPMLSSNEGPISSRNKTMVVKSLSLWLGSPMHIRPFNVNLRATASEQACFVSYMVNPCFDISPETFTYMKIGDSGRCLASFCNNASESTEWIVKLGTFFNNAILLLYRCPRKCQLTPESYCAFSDSSST